MFVKRDPVNFYSILQGYFIGFRAIISLPLCLWSNPVECEQMYHRKLQLSGHETTQKLCDYVMRHAVIYQCFWDVAEEAILMCHPGVM